MPGAIEEGTACEVMAVEFWEDGVADVIHLQVSEKFRRKGIGRRLLQLFYKMAQEYMWKCAVILRQKIREAPCSNFWYRNPMRL